MKTTLLGTDCTSSKEYFQNLLDPDNEADMATVIGLRILTQVYIYITAISIPQYPISYHNYHHLQPHPTLNKIFYCI